MCIHIGTYLCVHMYEHVKYVGGYMSICVCEHVPVFVHMYGGVRYTWFLVCFCTCVGEWCAQVFLLFHPYRLSFLSKFPTFCSHSIHAWPPAVPATRTYVSLSPADPAHLRSPSSATFPGAVLDLPSPGAPLGRTLVILCKHSFSFHTSWPSLGTL